MGRIIFTPITTSVTTDETGQAFFDILVPNTFNGNSGFDDPLSNGRYFKYAQFWTINGSDGDTIQDMLVQDSDGVIPVPLRALFPNYPDIQPLSDPDIPDQSTLIRGIGIPTSGVITINPVDTVQNRGLQFIPSGLHMKGNFIAGNQASGRILWINIFWGKWVAV